MAAHRAAAELDDRSLERLADRAMQEPPTRGFRSALADAEGLAVISEIKRRSPSKGDLAPDLDPLDLADAYQEGGATCLSVLTDEHYFGGSAADLAVARGACELPVLRKDFTVSIHDVFDARLMGADAMLLIVSALHDGELRSFHDLAIDLGLDVLVEVHDEAELERAHKIGAKLIGVNQRDLYTFEVDHERAMRLFPLIDDEAITVGESGVRGVDDARALAEAGYDAILVGETLVTAEEPRDALRALRGLE